MEAHQEANWTDKIGSRPLLGKMRHAHFLREIDKAEGAIESLNWLLEREASLNAEGATCIAGVEIGHIRMRCKNVPDNIGMVQER